MNGPTRTAGGLTFKRTPGQRRAAIEAEAVADERERIGEELERDWLKTGPWQNYDGFETAGDPYRRVLAILDGEARPKPESEPGYVCGICGRRIINEARGGIPPSAGDHDPGEHVVRAYAAKETE